LPQKGHTIPKVFQNFYNCTHYDRVSHFSETKSFLVGLPGAPFPTPGPPGHELPGQSVLCGHPKHPR
jgi:hypothetical protein